MKKAILVIMYMVCPIFITFLASAQEKKQVNENQLNIKPKWNLMNSLDLPEYGYDSIKHGSLLDLLSDPEKKKIFPKLDTLDLSKVPTRENNVDDEESINEKLKILAYEESKQRICDDELKVSRDRLLAGFDLLRSVPKRVGFFWTDWDYDEETEDVLFLNIHYVEDNEFVSNLLSAIQWPRIMVINSYSGFSNIGRPNVIEYNFQRGIFFETDKQRIFIVMTATKGFHLGRWKEGFYDKFLLFYSPSLAFAIEKYMAIYPIEAIDALPLKFLSGVIEINNTPFDDENEEDVLPSN